MSDTSERLLQRYVRSEAAEPTLPDEIDDLGAFGWLRGQRDRALYLELRKKDGSVRAVGYAWLSEIHFDPSDGITLCFSGQKIRLIGRNLDREIRPNVRLLSGLLRQRVPWVREADEGSLLKSGEAEACVERIVW